MFLILVISTGLILFNIAGIGCSDVQWIKSLKESVDNDGHIYQVVFMNDEKPVTKYPIFEEMFKELSSTIPVYNIILPNYDEPTKSDFTTYNPRISLFVLTNFENSSEITRSFDFLTRLSESKRRPKCLLVLSKALVNHRQFFKILWSRQFLDVTIIEKGKLETALDDDREDYKVIQYNPFLDLISNAAASLDSIWFPDKLKNLHGYPLIGSVLPAPPDVFAKRNSSLVSGLAIKKIEILRRELNFTFLVSSIREWGKFTCTNAKGTGAIEALFNNEVQIMGVERSRSICKGKGVEFSKGLRTLRLALIVPMIKKDVDSVKVYLHKTSIITFIVPPIFLWFVSRIMNFHLKKWRLEYMFRITFGTAVPEEPETVAERIIFVSFLLGCFMFSSVIYSSITDVHLENTSSFQFETFEDILFSNLQILFNDNYYFLANSTDDLTIQEILKKSILTILSSEECMKRLLKYKNNTCFFEVATAELILRNKRDKCGGPLVKFFTDNFSSGSGATLLGAGVPYARRFDQVLQRLIESGISEQWMKSYSMRKDSFAKIDSTCNSKNFELALAMRQMVFVFVTGLGFSILAFILELIVGFILKNRRIIL